MAFSSISGPPHDRHSLVQLRSHPVRRVTYEEAEASAKQLAARLVDRVGLDELRRCRYVPIPRGGLLVLGMLSYVLDIPSGLLRAGESDSRLVVVDDVAYTGERFAQFLGSRSEKRVIFAHLFSAPQLRDELIAAEPRVEACVAGSDLKDVGAERFEDVAASATWRQKWAERVGGTRYWMGASEHLVLPWSEPKFGMWDEERQSFDYGWRQGSPDSCLANWGSLGVTLKEPGVRRYRIPIQVAYRLEADAIQLFDLRTGTISAVEGVAADIWRGLAVYGNLDQTVELLRETYDADPAQLNSDVHGFAEELIRNGLLEPSSDAES